MVLTPESIYNGLKVLTGEYDSRLFSFAISKDLVLEKAFDNGEIRSISDVLELICENKEKMSLVEEFEANLYFAFAFEMFGKSNVATQEDAFILIHYTYSKFEELSGIVKEDVVEELSEIVKDDVVEELSGIIKDDVVEESQL